MRPQTWTSSRSWSSGPGPGTSPGARTRTAPDQRSGALALWVLGPLDMAAGTQQTVAAESALKLLKSVIYTLESLIL